MTEYDMIIIGGGVSGMGASIYSARFNLRTLIIAGRLGGLIQDTHVVENYPGFKSISGTGLVDEFKKHVRDYKLVEIKDEFAKDISKEKIGFSVKTDKGSYDGKTVLFSTGTRRKKLDVHGGKEFENRGLSYCATCLPPDESIILNSSIGKIKDITPMNRVLTTDGTYQEIAGFTKTNFSGKLVKIKPRLFNEAVSLTPNHPVLKTRITKGNGKNYFKNFKIHKPEWIEAGALTTEDCVLYPIIQETVDKKDIKLSEFIDVKKLANGFVKQIYSTITSNKVTDKIKVDNDLLLLFGYYLAKGTAHKHQLLFYFHKNEKSYAEDVIRILKSKFGLTPHDKIEKNVRRISLFSKVVADFFKTNFGKFAYLKKIPHWITTLPPEKQKHLIRALFRGDGCMGEKDFTFVTFSRNLAYQTRDILLRLDILPGVHLRDKIGLNSWQENHSIGGRKIYLNHDKYNVVVGGPWLQKISDVLGEEHPLLKKRKQIFHHAWIKDGYAVLPIREIDEVEYTGPVLNIGVKGNNTYVAKNFVVHNCDGPLFKDKIVGVIGGSDSAAKEALLLTEHAKKVYIIYRKEKIHPEPINMTRVEQAMKKGKLEIINNTNVVEVKGDKLLSHIVFDKEYNGSKEFKLDGLFVEIGHIVESDMAKKLGAELDDHGQIIVDKESKTNVPGLFAAGDVTDRAFKQAITGVAEGCVAANSAYEYISESKIKPK